MKSPVNIPEFFTGDMCVDLRCGDIAVAEEFLNHSKIHSLIQEISRKTMTEHVRCCGHGQAREYCMALDHFFNRAGSEPQSAPDPAAVVNEKRFVVVRTGLEIA